MREIKFRAVRLSDGQVFVPIAIYQTGDEPVVEWISDTGHSQLSDTPGNEVVLMQYTGFKDKDGREIFELDVVENIEGTFVVRYDGRMGWFGLYEHVSGKAGTNKEWRFTETVGTRANSMAKPEYRIRVIGNIYENPELLQ